MESMDTEVEDLEEVLREIYDNFNPEDLGIRSPKRVATDAVRIDTPSKHHRDVADKQISIAIAEISEAVIKTDLVKSLQEYRIARIQYVPSVKNNIYDALIVAITPLPPQLELKGEKILLTTLEQMSEKQRRTFRSLI